MIIEQAGGEAAAALDAVHAAREQALSAARALIRQCATTIRALHRGEFDQGRALLAEAARLAAQLRAAGAPHPEVLFAGYTQDALKEYAEAALVLAFLSDGPAPTAQELGVEPAAYLNGMAEAASELRRAVLDGLRRGETARGEQLLQIMDDVYSLCVTIDYPDAVTGGLRRTTDALRAVVERTRGDLTSAIRQDQLVAALARVERSSS